jgi:hypothetical protein
MQHVKAALVAALITIAIMALVNRVEFLKKIVYPAA